MDRETFRFECCVCGVSFDDTIESAISRQQHTHDKSGSDIFEFRCSDCYKEKTYAPRNI